MIDLHHLRLLEMLDSVINVNLICWMILLFVQLCFAGLGVSIYLQIRRNRGGSPD